MKKQINPTTKAHLIRGAFYLLLLLAVCAIPFALAQSRSRGTAKPGVTAVKTPQSIVPANPDSAYPSGISQPQLPRVRTDEATMRASGAVDTTGAAVVKNLFKPMLPGTCPPGTWSNATIGPSARYRAGGTTDGTYVYVYGGQTSTGGFLNDLWRWNPATQTWTQLANMPTAKGNIQGAYWNGKIYVPGGYIGSHITENAIYDIASNMWTTGAPLPAPQSGQNVAFNNKIYNFGGNPGPQSTVTIYDIATNTWSNGAAMPIAITYGRATATCQYAYYVGGIAGGVTVPTVYRYDFAANTWATMAPLQTARTSEELMTSSDQSNLYAVMGGDATFFTGVPLPVSVEIYDIAGNTWSYGNPVVTKAAAPSGGLAGGKAMVQGGVDSTTYLDAVQYSVVPCGIVPCGGTPTPTATGTPSPTPTATATPCTGQYTIAQIGGSIVPGTTDIGNHGDDTVTTIPLPFSYTLYDQTFTSINLSSNGNAQFTTVDTAFTNICLPWTAHNYTIFPYWDDLYLVNSGFGIFTSISGTAPNRIFNIEWRSQYFPGSGTANLELRLYEGLTRFDVIYGTVTNSNTSATAGVQKNDTAFDQYFCNGAGQPATGGQSYILTPCGTPTPTPTASPSATPTATGIPSATPTATCAVGWSAGPNMPTVLVRAVGVYFPDGNFYTMGGRTADTAGSDFQHVLKYSPGTNSWTQMGVTLPDATMNNMACGTLTLGGTPEIYCVGGSQAGQTTATARVFYYNPAADTVVTLTGADNWPGDAAGTILPGGFAETGNKMYILGGFNINVASTNQIWQFDPNGAVGAKWLQRVNTPEGIMYAPTCAINGIVYVGGASDYSGGTVIDTTNSFSFNPTTNTTGAIAAIPRATGETRALNFNGKMMVIGGGRVAPNPSSEVDVFDPVSDTWAVNSPVPAFTNARRNFPTDTDGTTRTWLAVRD